MGLNVALYESGEILLSTVYMIYLQVQYLKAWRIYIGPRTYITLINNKYIILVNSFNNMLMH